LERENKSLLTLEEGNTPFTIYTQFVQIIYKIVLFHLLNFRGANKMLFPMLPVIFLLSTSFELATPTMLNTKLLKSTVKKADAALKSLDDLKLDWQPSKVERRMREKNPGFGFARRPSKSSLIVAKRATALEMATKKLMAETDRVRRQTVDAVKAEFGSLFQEEVNAALQEAEDVEEDEDGCPSEPRKCFELDLSFRSLTGRCNSFTFPDFGKALQPLRRLLPARYADGERLLV
jgi:hypothetical protein